MKNFKFVIVLSVLFLALGTTTQAQNAKIIEKANQKIEKIENRITSVDPALAMSPEQKEQAQKIYADGLMQLKEIRKNTTDEAEKKEKMKPVNKAMNKAVRTEVLTKEQKMALKKNNEMKKG